MTPYKDSLHAKEAFVTSYKNSALQFIRNRFPSLEQYSYTKVKERSPMIGLDEDSRNLHFSIFKVFALHVKNLQVAHMIHYLAE